LYQILGTSCTNLGDDVPGSDAIAVFTNVPPLAVLWPFLLAAGIYALLRWVIRAPGGGPTPVTAAQHAYWVGFIGWLASSLQPAANAGILRVPSPGSTAGTVDILPALAWPVLGCLAVHAIGQLSFPGPQLPRRQVTLDVRRVRDFLPRPLGWTVLAIFVAAAGQIAWTATVPGFAPVPYESRHAPDNQYVTYGGDGRIPGIELAAYLGGALIILAAGTLLVLALITHRRRLEALTVEDNGLLRTIAMNRLLRTVATIASGLGAIAGNHAARPDPFDGTGSWFNPAGLLNLAVLLVMWRWAPPTLSGGMTDRVLRADPHPHPATKLSVSVGPAMGLAVLVPVLAALLIPGAITGHPAVSVAISAAAVLAVVAAGELLLHSNYGDPNEPRHWPRQPVSPAMLSTAIAAVSVLVGVTIIVGTRQAELTVPASWGATAWTSVAVAVISVLPLAMVRRRRSVPAAIPGLDAALRAITLHRVVRTLAAFFTVQAGVLLMAAGHRLKAAYPLGPGPWDDAWQAAPGIGVLLAAAGAVIAVIPVRGLAVTRPAQAAPAPEAVA
jgi:hypothetical protein